MSHSSETANTVSQAIREAAKLLASTSDTARLDAELLMAHTLGVSRSDLLLRHDQDAAPDGFAALVDRRAMREPIAYIVGTQEFFGIDLRVTPDVLIPRSDSECVVQSALDAAPFARRVLDLGTGSGALLLATLAHLPQAEGTGIDASPAALDIARANAAALGAPARFFERDWTQEGWAGGLGRFDLILANPPYVEDDAQLEPDVRDYEPAQALFAGPEGLDDYRVIIPQLPQLLTETGVVMLEIGASQASPVSEIAREHGFTATAHKDLGGRDRALELRLTLGKGESSS